MVLFQAQDIDRLEGMDPAAHNAALCDGFSAINLIKVSAIHRIDFYF